jgi:hypothetical protein
MPPESARIASFLSNSHANTGNKPICQPNTAALAAFSTRTAGAAITPLKVPQAEPSFGMVG